MTEAAGRSYRGLRWTTEGSVALLTLDRTAALNALDRALKEDLREALEAAAVDPDVRAVVLTGAGRAFCVGQDLREVPEVGPGGDAGAGAAAFDFDFDFDFEAELLERYNPIVRALRGLEKPVVCAVNGVAAGAGMSIALACDLRVVAEGARFVPAFGSVGLVPDSGMSWLLPRIVGLGRASEILLAGREVGADEAERIGLANRVVPTDRLLPEAVALAARIAEGSPLALALTKRALNLSAEIPLDEALGLEAQFQGIAGRSADHAEGLVAFREKRRPRFGGG